MTTLRPRHDRLQITIGPRSRAVLLSLLSCASSSTIIPAASAADENVELPVFEVSSDRDRGYSSSYSAGATRMSLPLNEVPQNIAVLNEKFIRDVRPDSLSEITKYVAGVTESVGPTRDVFNIRGVSIGSPFTDGLPEVGSSQGFALDMNLFNRVEVLKGPTAVIYGSTASGGVVNRITKKPQFDRFLGQIDLEAGSFEHYRANIDVNQPFGAKNAFAVRVVGSYWDKKGEQDFFYKRRRFIAPMFGWRITPTTTATLQITDYHDRYHKGWGQIFTIPPYTGNNLNLSLGLGLPRERAYAEPYSTQWEEGRRYTLLFDHKVNEAWSLRFSAATSTYTYV
ncbi:MAG TPA: TonB-dependent receptor plug domain-containing protein, partial [Opitutaceae bacterium]|nr:TonB-dependent receptor plug domain-containing protein [Opitutaceae bacterium]